MNPESWLWLKELAISIPAAALFVVIMSRLKEPLRFELNVLLAGGAAATYLSGDLGHWELVYMVLATSIALMAIRRRSYPWIGVAWLLHTCWDTVHHFADSPLWRLHETSSAGCACFDALIAIWFFMGAPTVLGKRDRPAWGDLTWPRVGRRRRSRL